MLPTSEKIDRAKSIVDDPAYQQRRRPLLPQFQRNKNTGQPEYNEVAAYVAAVAAAWSYSDAEALRAELKDALEVDFECTGFSAKNAPLYLDTDVYFVRTSEPGLQRTLGVLVFRGTEFTSIGDFLADAYVEMIPFPSSGRERGRVHGGFSEGARAVWKRVYGMLMQHPVDDLIIAGHSLGGAIAVLAAARLFREYETLEDPRFTRVFDSLRGIYTFGQPAVGDDDFSKWYAENLGSRTFRHVFAKDLVPALPTSDVNALYQHFVSGVWTAKRDASTWSGPNEGLSFPVARYLGLALAFAGADFYTRRIPLRAKLLSRVLDALNPYSLDDHSPMNYVRVSEAAARVAAPTASLRDPIVGARMLRPTAEAE
jgi:pimeloyl-ACP methyl ester carboxylesterase